MCEPSQKWLGMGVGRPCEEPRLENVLATTWVKNDTTFSLLHTFCQSTENVIRVD